MEQNRPLISVKDLSRTYIMGLEKVHALRSITLQIRKNEYVALMGPSGSGKSTLMNILGCLDTPSSGEYYLNDQLVSDMTDRELAAGIRPDLALPAARSAADRSAAGRAVLGADDLPGQGHQRGRVQPSNRARDGSDADRSG